MFHVCVLTVVVFIVSIVLTVFCNTALQSSLDMLTHATAVELDSGSVRNQEFAKHIARQKQVGTAAGESPRRRLPNARG